MYKPTVKPAANNNYLLLYTYTHCRQLISTGHTEFKCQYYFVYLYEYMYIVRVKVLTSVGTHQKVYLPLAEVFRDLKYRIKGQFFFLLRS